MASDTLKIINRPGDAEEALGAVAAGIRVCYAQARVYLLSCHHDSYCASRVVAAIEGCDTGVALLGAFPNTTREGYLLVTVATTGVPRYDVETSLERYGFEVIASDLPSDDGDASSPDATLSDNADYLLRILDI